MKAYLAYWMATPLKSMREIFLKILNQLAEKFHSMKSKLRHRWNLILFLLYGIIFMNVQKRKNRQFLMSHFIS